MKELQKYFIGKGEVSGYRFTNLRQTDKASLYEVSSGNSKHYEVFRKVVNERYGCVSYPTSRAFGIWAWTYMSLERAERKFNELNS